MKALKLGSIDRGMDEMTKSRFEKGYDREHSDDTGRHLPLSAQMAVINFIRNCWLNECYTVL